MESHNFNTSEAASVEAETQENLMVDETTPEAPDSEAQRPQKNRVRRFLSSTLAAASFFASMPSEKASAAEPQEPRDGRPAIENAETDFKMERWEMMNGWLSELGNPDITVGEPTVRMRGPGENIGLYNQGKNFANLWSGHLKGRFTFDKEGFLSMAKTALQNAGILEKITTPTANETAAPKQELTIREGAVTKAAELGMILMQGKNKTGKKIVTLSANTKLADTSKAIFFEIDAEDDGRADSFAEIGVTEDGALFLKGRDGEPFHMEFRKGADGVVEVTEK